LTIADCCWLFNATGPIGFPLLGIIVASRWLPFDYWLGNRELVQIHCSVSTVMTTTTTVINAYQRRSLSLTHTVLVARTKLMCKRVCTPFVVLLYRYTRACRKNFAIICDTVIAEFSCLILILKDEVCIIDDIFTVGTYVYLPEN
jgi:hypothetical protein